MSKNLTTFDPADCLTSDRAIADFVAAAFETHDADYAAHALGVATRAKGIECIANKIGLSSDQVARSCCAGGNLTLHTAMTVLKALGVQLVARPTSPTDLDT